MVGCLGHRLTRSTLFRWIRVFTFSLVSLAFASAETPTRPAPVTSDKSPVRVLAQVDTSTVDLGTPFILTITVEGDLTKVQMQPVKFPTAFRVVAQSQATNLSMPVGGRLNQSLSLHYVLVAQQPGTFQLGPFQVTHQGKPLLTDPIQILVNKPLLPPSLQEQQRLLL